MNTKTANIEIRPDTIVLSCGAIQLLKKMLAYEESETQKLFSITAHWNKAEREEMEHFADKSSIKPLAELEDFIRTQELMRAYKQKVKQEN
ncbi:hypothetical protein LQM11_003080 [Vibrio parahaemolyticus]|nr:hypothetical protein [Vibrio parahaemolyticus]